MAHQTPQLKTPQQGKVWLILYDPSDSRGNFYLDIPMYVIEPLCLRPRKYLRYLGWCVLGIEGRVILGTEDIGDEGDLVNQGVYRYVVDATDPLAHAIDLEVIKQRSTVLSSESAHSGSTSTRNNFRKDLAERDGGCVFAHLRIAGGVHIIPYARGDEWFQLIIGSRQAYEEDVSGLLSINDIRNGLLVQSTIHSYMDARHFVILKTPNRVLDVNDISGDPGRFPLLDTIKYEYPLGERFSLQVVAGDLDRNSLLIAEEQIPKPSSLILHYNYGAAAVKLWGHRTEILARPNIPRSQIVMNHQSGGPSRDRNNGLIAIRKRKGHNNTGGDRGESAESAEVAGGGATDVTDDPTVVVQPMVGYRGWDEDDWMLFFWGNTPAARERYRAADEQSSNRIAKWATEVSNTAFVEPPSLE
ncbi:hypothetical protein BC827DRAFT_1159154 [Russula dissimulans]|nr:hypothetical protein BC827DRAFT_1159154 [Russula dissimulans]